MGRPNIRLNVEDRTERGWLRNRDNLGRNRKVKHIRSKSQAPLACCVVGSRILLRLNINSMVAFLHQRTTHAA